MIATLWRERPDVADAEALAALTLDPAAGVRRAAARAASAIRAWSLLDRLAEDPDPSVRRQAALSIGAARQPNPETDAVLDALADDIAMPVRAAAFAARLVQGTPVCSAPGVELREAAAALRESADLTTLRETARTASDENQRLAAALALALLQDEVAPRSHGPTRSPQSVIVSAGRWSSPLPGPRRPEARRCCGFSSRRPWPRSRCSSPSSCCTTPTRWS